jgi:transposase
MSNRFGYRKNFQYSGGHCVRRGVFLKVTRPTIRFVPIKNVEQQSALMLHRTTRDLLIRQRTQLISALSTYLAELGLVAAKGREGSWKSYGPISNRAAARSCA